MANGTGEGNQIISWIIFRMIHSYNLHQFFQNDFLYFIFQILIKMAKLNFEAYFL